MITNRFRLAGLALVGSVFGVSLTYLLFAGGMLLYAARRAQIYGEPARQFFVSGSVHLAIVPLLAVLACALFALAKAESPRRRGLTAWGLTVLAAPIGGVMGLVLSMVLITPDLAVAMWVVIALVGLAGGAIWIGVGRAAFDGHTKAYKPLFPDG